MVSFTNPIPHNLLGSDPDEDRDYGPNRDRIDRNPTAIRKVLPGGARHNGRAMSDREFQALIFDWATDARHFVDEFIMNERHDATSYYRGKLPDVDKDSAQEDRSQAVLTEVRDTVLGMMPDLLRIFFQADGVVRYMPVPATDPQIYAQRCKEASQATAYVQHTVLKVDNPDSFVTFYNAFQDALVRKTGFIKWQWEKTRKPKYSTHTGLTEEQMMILASDPEIEIVGKRAYSDPNPPPSPPSMPMMPGQPPVLPQPPPVLYDVKTKRIDTKGHIKLRGIPCEAIIIARRGTAVDRTSLIGMTEDKTVGDFIAEGLVDDAEDLADCDVDTNDGDNWETQARRPQDTTAVGPPDNPPADPSMRIIKYGELYVTVDRDGDGIPELIRIVTAGTQYKILQEEPVDEVPIAAFCPYPEAYQFFGESVADLTRDIQRIKSRILRDTLDSLAQSVTPQSAVVEGQVNLDDVLNPDTSKIIRMRQPGMVQPLVVPFVGKEALPILDLLTQVRENRTGQSDASAGLDPAVLQSSTASAVQATLTKAQSRVEMVARIFAETGMRQLFRGILHETIKNIDGPRAVRLNGEALAIIDPRSWNAEMDVEPILMLGRGSQVEQIGVLTNILAKQQEILTLLGFENPVVTLDQYSYTLTKIVELSGYRNTTSFFNDMSTMDPQAKQQAMQAMQQHIQSQAQQGQKSGPDPQIEQAKIASNEKIQQMKLQLEMAKEQNAVQIEMIKLKAQMLTQTMQMKADHQQAIDQATVDGHVDRFNAMLDAHVTHHGNLMDSAVRHSIAEMQTKAKAKSASASGNGAAH